MDRKQKGNFIGVIGTIVAHAILIIVLLLVTFKTPVNQDDGGVPVLLGQADASQLNYDPKTMIDVEVMETTSSVDPATAPAETVEEEIITQQDEETVAIKPKKETPKKEPKKEIPKKEPKKVVEKTEAEKKAEAKRLAEEKAERERKAAAEAAAKRVSGAFGKGTAMEANKGTSQSGTGVEGSKDGNSSSGEKNGTGGYGTFNLGGRSIGEGGLPKPVYNIQEGGRVVVSITVNPSGAVIDASIHLGQTNTVNTTLRNAALKAAKNARFNAVSGNNNQMGTITYYFNLK